MNYKIEKISSWNNTLSSRAKVYYPENIEELKIILSKIRKNKKKYIIKTGGCSYDSKSINPNFDTYVISMKKFNKLIKINKKKGSIYVQAGTLVCDIIKKIKQFNYSLHAVPGGEKISVGGAISANVIGKDSNSKIAAFGDTILKLVVLDSKNRILKISSKNKSFRNYIGSFGTSGIILECEIKLKKIISNNLVLKSKILKNLNEVKKDLKLISDYKYIQIDPFFREKNFAISFFSNYLNLNKNLYKNISLKSMILEKLFFKFSGYFINNFTWRIFYSLFFYFNKLKSETIDLHNFHYPSKYKHLIPLAFKRGINDYEILINKNFIYNMGKIIKILKKNKLFPIYIVVKKLYKSKKKYYYQFNRDGIAVAISLKKDKNEKLFFEFVKREVKKNNFKINLSKTDRFFLNKIPKNQLFMSLYKQKIFNNGLSR